MGIKFKQSMLVLTLAIAFSPAAFAQEPAKKDTTPVIEKKADTSLLEETKESILDNITTVALDENELSDASSQNVSSVLTAARDPYFSAASYNFSAVRFRIRGYDNELFSTYMNGIPMDNLDNGFTPYGLWGGLNDVTRNKDVTYGLRYNTFAFGDIGSTTNIDSRASRQRKQTSFSYALTNRNYRHRWTLTHSTGVSKKGWAFTFSGSRRWAGEGYVPGTYYDGWSYFAAVDKRIDQNNLLSLTVFGAPTESGNQGAAVKESMDLAGDNYYNPNWGWQAGKKRNARVTKSNQPVAILTHDLRINNATTLITALGYSGGDRSVTGLDWYNAPDPRPDYYRYLPSYYNGAANNDPYQYNQLLDLMKNDENYRQINWLRLYDVNRASFESVQNANGIEGNTVSGKRSRYILEERVVNTKRLNFNTVLNTRIGNHVDLTFGASAQKQANRYYKKVNDLLGGDFYLNVNQFAERDFPNESDKLQNDLNQVGRIVRKGDKYGYDYEIDLDKVAAFGQGVFKFNKVDFFLAGEVSYSRFWRIGYYKNGLFPENSYGGSKRNTFTNYAVKGGVTYKINGRNYIYVSGAVLTKAPYFENAYLSPRTRNSMAENVVSETVQSVEGGYIMNAPKLKIRISGYLTHFKDGMDLISFYDDSLRTFGNMSLSKIDKLHFGGEFGLEAKIAPGLTLNAAAGIGRYYYDSRQQIVITVDNNDLPTAPRTVYSQNYRVPSTPQEAYSLGLTYRSPKFWFVSLTGNYFDQNWLSFSPIRRTDAAVSGVEYKSEAWNSIIDQVKFDSQYTLDFFAGYSWKLPKKYKIAGRSTYLVFNAGVNNLLNNQDISTGGYEQLRFDYANKDVNKFPPKLYYAYGLNYFLSATIRF